MGLAPRRGRRRRRGTRCGRASITSAAEGLEPGAAACNQFRQAKQAKGTGTPTGWVSSVLYAAALLYAMISVQSVAACLRRWGVLVRTGHAAGVR